MAKRANSEGSVYRRADGRWVAAVSLEGGRRKFFYGKTRAEVSRQLVAALKARQDGLPLPAERQTVGQYLTAWLEDSVRSAVRQTTYENYSATLRKHVLPEIGSIRLARLSPQDLSRLYGRMLSRGLSARTVRLAHAILHKALAQAVRWNLVARNAADAVDPPRLSRHEPRILTPEQASRLMAVAKEDRLYALYVLALMTGLRQAELLGLRWSDVDLDAATLTVRQQAIRTSSGWGFTEPKTARGRRLVTLPALAVAALREHRREQARERLAMGAAWEDNDLVFTNQLGRPIEKQNLTRRSFRPLLERAGLPRIRFHDLRHSAATLLLQQGVHPKVVQERLGHSTISVTMDIYSHVMPTLQREAAQQLDRLFAGR